MLVMEMVIKRPIPELERIYSNNATYLFQRIYNLKWSPDTNDLLFKFLPKYEELKRPLVIGEILEIF